MPDLASPYTLTTPGGTVLFNDYGTDRFNEYGPDEFYITEITGLDGEPIRAPRDRRPQTHGGLVHPYFFDARLVGIEGVFMIRSTKVQNTIRMIRNDMEKELLTALKSIIDTDGTLSWVVPLTTGNEARTLTVRYEIPVEYRGIELKTFTFSLVAADPDFGP